MKIRLSWRFFPLAVLVMPFLCQCTVKTRAHRDSVHAVEVSVPQQQMAVYREGELIHRYPVSTSKFGEGDQKGSYKTPLGKFEVAEKIGGGFPLGAVFKSRQWTGEVLKPDAPGRDPIVSRILWLNGLEKKNRNAYSRCIYIHGTAAERDVGKKASYGCVRMRSRDIIQLYEEVGWGVPVQIVNRPLWSGTENPELPLAGDASIPLVMVAPVELFEIPGGDEIPWSELTPDDAAYRLLEENGFDLSYLKIEPVRG